MHKICIISGSRADYGLLDPLITKCQEHFEVQLVVTGSHLSHEFGYTVKDIKHPIAEKVEIVLSSDTPVGISKSMGLACISFGEVFDRRKPDLLIVLGDRWEVLAAVSSAHIAQIPVAHLHGGEVTEGSYDDSFRHAITHASQLHFVAAPEYMDRLMRMGQEPRSVFGVGALGCDALEKRRNFKSRNSYLIAMYPETIGGSAAAIDIPKMLSEKSMMHAYVTSGSDVGAIKGKPISARGFDRKTFLQHLKNSDFIIGNSSSIVIEAPALGVPGILIGDRQKGRLLADSVVTADPTPESIFEAFDYVYSQEFQDLMKTDYFQPYKGGNVAEKIVRIIKDRMPVSVRKEFYDGP